MTVTSCIAVYINTTFSRSPPDLSTCDRNQHELDNGLDMSGVKFISRPAVK